MEPFNFNELPDVVRRLFEKVERIEQIVANLLPAEGNDLELLDVAEAAEYLKITPGALYTKVSRKEIACSKAGRKLYFSREDLKEYIEHGRRKTAAEIQNEAQQRYGNRRRIIR